MVLAFPVQCIGHFLEPGQLTVPNKKSERKM
jgi:hypothetical protein